MINRFPRPPRAFRREYIQTPAGQMRASVDWSIEMGFCTSGEAAQALTTEMFVIKAIERAPYDIEALLALRKARRGEA